MNILKKNLTEVILLEFTVMVGLLFTELEKRMILTVLGLVFIGFIISKFYGVVNTKKEKEEQKRNSKKKFYYKKKGGKR